MGAPPTNQDPIQPWPYSLGAPLDLGALTVWPLLQDGAPPATVHFTPLADAQAQGLVEVTEQPGGANVGTVEIVNHGDGWILALAGTALQGGLQDRQIGADLILAPHKTHAIDAFCVERGRWGFRETQRAAGFVAQPILTSKTVRRAAHFDRSQTDVWREVATINERRRRTSDTETHFASLTAAPGAEATDRADVAGRVQAHLSAAPTAVGVAWASRAAGIELRTFADPITARAFFPTLANTIAFERTVAAATEDDPAEGPADPARVHDTVAAAAKLARRWEAWAANENELGADASTAYAACWYRPEGSARRFIATATWQRAAK